MTKLLINASNLHVGGAVQVAVSIIDELSRFSSLPGGLDIWVSSVVDKNLKAIGTNVSIFECYRIINNFGFNIRSFWHDASLEQYDAVFTVFGPLYVWRRSFVSITGFAQPWIIYPRNEVEKKMSLIRRWLYRLKFNIQSVFFCRDSHLVVELEHVRTGLLKKRIGSTLSIHVIRNCLSAIYTKPETWIDLLITDSGTNIKLGFVGRNYAHKNTAIFPSIVAELEQTYAMKARFYVTFTEQEWNECTPDFRAVCINIGVLSVAQCPRFYQALDAIVFPSLLECFSAAPLEAMAMGKPLFVSDRSFNRDICGSHAHYFDPLDPISAASAIAHVFKGAGPGELALCAARDHSINFSCPKERAQKSLTLLIDSVSHGVARP